MHLVGCVCCTAEADLVGTIIELLKDRSQIDHLVIECSGMAQVRIYLSHAIWRVFLYNKQHYNGCYVSNLLLLPVEDTIWVMVPIYAYSFTHCSPNQVQVKTITHNTISVVDGWGLPSLILCLRDE